MPRTRLVVMGAAGSVDESLLEAAFASCAEGRRTFSPWGPGRRMRCDRFAIDKVR